MNYRILFPLLKYSLIIALLILSLLEGYSQNIILKSISYQECINKELGLNSKKISEEIDDQSDKEEDIILFSSQSNASPFYSYLDTPIEFLRSQSDFHINPETAYYFDNKDSILLFFEMKWNVNNELDIFSRDFINSSNIALEKESKKKKLYVHFYKQLIAKITKEYGPPTKRKKVKIWEAYNCDGWLYEWKTSDYLIKARLRLPKEGIVEFIYIEYSIAWK